MLERQGDDAAALEQYRKVLQIKPDFAHAHLKMAYILVRQNRLSEALQYGREALRINPDLYQLHNVLGLALMRQGKLEEATRQFSEALRLEPGYTDTRNNLNKLQSAPDRLGNPITHIEDNSQTFRFLRIRFAHTGLVRVFIDACEQRKIEPDQ